MKLTMVREILLLALFLYYLEIKGCLGEEVCFANLGCFSNEFPYNSTYGELPLDPSFIQTNLMLYTRQNRDVVQTLELSDISSIRRSHFDPQLPIKIIIHGFVQDGRVEWIRDMARLILHKEAANVISVDWSGGSGFPYTQAAANTRVVGAEIASFISIVKNAFGISPGQFHLIGHSLGAHVAGYTGERVAGLQRITGLDPAEPNFKEAAPQARLDPGDAHFVDVIHTDGTEFNDFSGFGMLKPLGHADFYPNGGVNQPGCPNADWFNLFRRAYDNGVIATEDTLSCSHSRSIYLFMESINSLCPFTAFPCDSLESFRNGECLQCTEGDCPSMGYNLDPSTTGTYYLETASSQPYCGYNYQVRIQFGSSMSLTRGTLHIRFLGMNGLSDYFQVESGNTRFQRNSTWETTFLSRINLGRVLQVQMSYEPSSGWFSFGSRTSISLGMVTVRSSPSNTRFKCCGYSQAVGINDIGFNCGSYETSDCNGIPSIGIH